MQSAPTNSTRQNFIKLERNGGRDIVKSVLLMALQNQQGVEVGSVMEIFMMPVYQEAQEGVRSGLSKKKNYFITTSRPGSIKKCKDMVFMD